MSDSEDIKIQYPRLEVIQHSKEYLRHQKALFSLWDNLSSNGANDPNLNVEAIANVDVICRGYPKKYDPNFRQRGRNGETVSNLKQLYESAVVMKPNFDTALRKIGSQFNLPTFEWDCRSPLPAHPGLILCSLKAIDRATDKAKEKYSKIDSGPPESWLFDVVRACFVCETEEQICSLCEKIHSFPHFEVIRLKNRFLHPCLSGFRDIQLTVRMVVNNQQGHSSSFICEVVLTHLDLVQYETENRTRDFYTYFRPLFTSPVSTQDALLNVLTNIVEECEPVLSNNRSTESELEDGIRGRVTELCTDLQGCQDPLVLESWVKVCAFMKELESAEMLQRKLLKVLVIKHTENHSLVADALDRLATLLKSQDKLAQSYAMFEKSVFVRREIGGERNAEVASSLYVMGLLLAMQRKFSQALQLHDQQLLIRRQLFGNDHAEVAASLLVIAQVQESLGQHDQAKLYYRNAIDVWRKVYGDFHPCIATAMNSLALLLDASHSPEEARDLFEQALAIRIAVYGPTHFSVAGSLNNLALSLKKLNLLDEARPLYEQSLAIRISHFGERHPSVATTLNNLGLLLKKQKKYEEALPLYYRALEIRREHYGSDHAEVAASLNNLALLLDAMGKPREALSQHEKALAIRLRLLGPEHRSVAETYANMAAVLHKAKEYLQARQMYENALGIRLLYGGEEQPEVRSILANIASLNSLISSSSGGPLTYHERASNMSETDSTHLEDDDAHLRMHGQEHYMLAMSLRGIALDLQKEGATAESIPLLENSLSLLYLVFDEENAQLAIGLMLLADALRAGGKVSDPLQMYVDATLILRVLYGNVSPRVIQALLTQASLLVQQQSFETATVVLEETLMLTQQLHGDENVEVALVVSELAKVCKLDGNYLGSKKLHEQALSMRMKHAGEGSPLVAQSLSDLAMLMLAMEQPKEAIALHKHALTILRSAYSGDTHEDVGHSHRLLGLVYKEQQDWSAAKTHLEAAVQIFRKVHADQDSLSLASALNELATVLIFHEFSGGNLDRAVPLFKTALEIRLRRLGRINADTAETYHDLGQVLKAYTTPHERALAIYCLEEALAIRRDLYSEEVDHPDVVESLSELASLLMEERIWSPCLKAFAELVAVREREFPGDDSELLAMAYRDAAIVHLRCDDTKQACVLMDAALEVFVRIFGDDSSDVATCYVWYGEIREAEEKHNKAKHCYQKAMEIRVKVFGEHHPFVAECLEAIAQIRIKTGALEKGRELLRHAIHMRHKWSGDGLTDLAMAYDSVDVVRVLYLQERFEEALPICLENLQLMQDLNAQQPHCVADVMVQLVQIKMAMLDYAPCKKLLCDAIAIRRDWLGQYAPEVADALKLYSSLLQKMDLMEEAVQAVSSYLEIHQHNSEGRDSMSVASSFIDLAILLDSMKRYRDSLVCYSESLELVIRIKGMQRSADVAKILLAKARCYRSLSEFEDCKRRNEQAVALLRLLAERSGNDSGDEQLDLADGLAQLTEVEVELGHHQNAFMYCWEAINIRRRILGGLDGDYMASLYQLAIIQEKLGKFKDALTNAENTVRYITLYRPPEDPVISDTLTLIANLLFKLGRLDEALVKNDEVVALLVRCHGALALCVMDRYAFQAGVLKLAGRYHDAERLYRQVVSRYEEVRGATHANTVAHSFSLALVTRKLCKYAEAESLLRSVVTNQEVLFGRESCEVASSLNALGSLLLDGYHISEAAAIIAESLAIRQKLLGERHADIASSLNNLGCMLEMQGKLHDAKARHHQALALRCEIYGKKHPAVAQSLTNLGGVYCSLGKYSDAQALYGESLSILTKAFSNPNHPDVAGVVTNLGFCYESQDRLEEARELYTRALDMYQAVFGALHPLVAQARVHLAAISFRGGDVGTAMQAMTEALRVVEKAHGEESLPAAEILNNIGNMHVACNSVDRAVEVHEKSLRIVTATLGEGHSSTMNVRGNLGISLHAAGERARGKAMVAEVLAHLYKNHFPLNHPWVNKFSAAADAVEVHVDLPVGHVVPSNGAGEVQAKEVQAKQEESEDEGEEKEPVRQESINLIIPAFDDDAGQVLGGGYTERKSDDTVSTLSTRASFNKRKSRPGIKINALSRENSLRSQMTVQVPKDFVITPKVPDSLKGYQLEQLPGAGGQRGAVRGSSALVLAPPPEEAALDLGDIDFGLGDEGSVRNPNDDDDHDYEEGKQEAGTRRLREANTTRIDDRSSKGKGSSRTKAGAASSLTESSLRPRGMAGMVAVRASEGSDNTDGLAGQGVGSKSHSNSEIGSCSISGDSDNV